MLDVRDRSAPVTSRDYLAGGSAVVDDGALTDGDLVDETDLADAIGEEWDNEDPVVKRLFDDLVRGEHAKAVMAEAQMRRVIEFNQSVDHRFVEGLGQLVARIPLSVYLHWTALYGHDFWDQPDSLEFFASRAGGGRGNPGLLIKTAGRPTLVVDGLRDRQTLSGGRSEIRGVSSAPAPAAGATATAKAPEIPRGIKGRRGRWAQPASTGPRK